MAELDTAGIAAVLAAQAAIKNLRDLSAWIFNCCLCGGQAGDGNTVGRAADVVQANVVAELDTAGIAAVLAAQAAIKNLRDLSAWIFNCCLCGGQAGDGNTVGRAADVVQANVVAELDTAGIAAVLAAQAAIKNLRDLSAWIFNCCLCGGQAGDGNTVGRAADVVQANVVAELDTAGIAAVLAAQAAIKNLRDLSAWIFNCCLCGGQAGDGNMVGRAADVQANVVAELDTAGIAAVLAAQAAIKNLRDLSAWIFN